MTRPSNLVACVALSLMSAVTALLLMLGASGALTDGARAQPGLKFVGSETCVGCHRAEAELWRTSQHKQAMDHATEKTVLGNFDNAVFDYHGVHSRFFRKDGKFFVETDGPDGKLATFEIKYTFGVYPLQQYLITFPDGRIQALSIAWDSRPREQGGQRWIHLYPNENIRHDDILHWTKLNQNWNYMCAECHSTDLRKNYDAAADRYSTTWNEINVGCEACHGQGSRHIAWAQARNTGDGKADDPMKGLIALFDERQGISWGLNPQTPEPERSKPPALLRKEVETCGRCHARRGQFSENWIPGQWLSDTHEVSGLNRTHYHADGQMRDIEETYNYGPFRQSRMFAKGVTCSDCHDPHSAKLRVPGSGVCLQCHTADKYQTASHSRHETKTADCISCHMPARNYMVVDPRHDHSFRVPRPDLSVKLGTPNACNGCHSDKPAQWAADAVTRWYGPERKGYQRYAEAFHADWTGQAGAAKLLAEIAADSSTPAFVRASAFNALNAHPATINATLARTGLSDPDPMVRIGALDMLVGIPADRLWPLVSPLLSDPVRGVRIRAASVLATMPADNLPDAERERFERAAAEFVAAQRLNADRPESRAALGTFYAQRRRPAEAESEYRAALRLSPQFAPAAVNLADLYRALGRERESADVLRQALVASPQDAGLHHALGLALVRMKQSDAALPELRRAAELAPEQARYAYVYAVGLNTAGRTADAIAALRQNLAVHPAHRDTLLALILFSRDAGDIKSALEYAERYAQSFPDDRRIGGLIRDLKTKAK